MTFLRWTIPTPSKWRGSLCIRLFAIFSFALLIAVSGALAASERAEAQGKSLSFDNPPTEVSVTSGTADKNVVKLRASGLNNQKRIRYSVSGNSAFSITPKTGRVRYDGSSIIGAFVRLTVTARDVKGKYESVSHTFKVNNSAFVQPTPKNHGECSVGLVLNVGDSCIQHGVAFPEAFYPQAFGPTVKVFIHNDGRPRFQFRCWGFARCTESSSSGALSQGGLTIEKRQGKWTITSVPS